MAAGPLAELAGPQAGSGPLVSLQGPPEAGLQAGQWGFAAGPQRWFEAFSWLGSFVVNVLQENRFQSLVFLLY